MINETNDKLEVINGPDYQSLMGRRIRNILLVCNSYDGFSLEEDGRIESQINQEYSDLNLSNPPVIRRAESTAEAVELMKETFPYDLVITMYNVGEPGPFEFASIVKKLHPHVPVVLLTNFSKEIYREIDESDTSDLDYVFCWHGSADLIIAIIKLIEDKMNAAHDIHAVGVQCILLIEDSIRYYSSYLPEIYKLILQQTGESIKEALNEHQQKMRKRARPKIMLATNYTEAVELYEEYKENLLGVISDVGFVIHKGDRSENEKLDAGIDLCKLIKKDNPLMPFILQSSQESMREVAKQLGVGFVVKYSKTLIMELSEYISREFAFGDFVFKDPETGSVVGRAKDLRQLQEQIAVISDDVLMHSASQNLLSKWMLSRGIFSLGNSLRKIQADQFSSVAEIRAFIIERIKDYRISIGQGVVARFDNDTYNDSIWFARMGNGSLGGKARGLAFLNSMLQKYNLYDKYEDVRVMIPRTVVVSTDYFDQFIRENGLQYVIKMDNITDDEILSEFVSSRLPQGLVDSLRVYIKYVKRPLAIRSSSKLEDSYYQPFAGIYSTYMIPVTDNPDQMIRLLEKAIKSVYASVYFANSRAYITATSNVISDEKMGVVIQEVCGSEDRGYYFPTMSGVARSMNFYPIGDEKPADGVVKLAFGLGKAVVDGEQVLRFSPKYPKKILQLSSPQMAFNDTQKVMYALNLMPEKFKISIDDAVNLERFEINKARDFRNMRYAASTWDMQNGILVDSPMGDGAKVITFAHILKYNIMPLSEILTELLEIGQREMRCCIELEFAVNMDVKDDAKRVFNLLQIRPISNEASRSQLDWSKVTTDDAIIYSENAIGIGPVDGVTDVIYIKQADFDAAATPEIAKQITFLNSELRSEKRGYVLVGPGRWGSSDPWLGVPVEWPQISEAKIIVECGLKSYNIEPSQGTHFFQNLTSFGVGYLTINPYMNDGYFNEDVLKSMEAVRETQYVRHVRFERPLFIFADGINNKGIVKL